MNEQIEIVSPLATDVEKEEESTLRPTSLFEFVGQSGLKAQIATLLQAAKRRRESLDHILFYGPPGLGKTTLAQIIASEMGGNLKISSGPAIEHPGDLASILTSLCQGDIFFIDETHRLSRVVEEALYPAMEDFAFDIVVGKGAGAQILRLPLEHFTVVGATTKAGSLSAPFRDRFGATFRLDFYTLLELKAIVERSAKILRVSIDESGATNIASRARGTPRVANRLLKRVRDFAEIHRNGIIDGQTANDGLDFLGIDKTGLDDLDRRFLTYLCTAYLGRAAGLSAIAAGIQEDEVTLSEIVEPYLLRLGLIVRTPKGRMATRLAYETLEKVVPELE